MRQDALLFVSPLCGADPRTLLLAAATAAFCFSAIQSLALSCVVLALALTFSVLCGPPWRLLLKRLVIANFFILFLWLTVPWTIPGTTILVMGPLKFSWEGVALAMRVTLKCNAILLTYITLMSDMDLFLMGHAMERLYMPAKLVFLFLFTCRYIHVIGDEWKRLQIAALLRGFTLRTSFHTYRTIGNMLGLTFVNSMERAKRIYEAMLLRGFNGHFQTATELKMGKWDVVFLFSFFLVAFFLVVSDMYITYYHD